MTKAATLTLISDLSKGQTDATAIGRFYDDVVRELGRVDVLVRATLIESVIDQAGYTLPDAVVERQATFFDMHTLDEVNTATLETLGINWRDDKGTPIAVFTENQTENAFSLYPLPQSASGTVAGGNFGTSFPVYAISSIHTNFETDLPVWLELPITFSVLHREFIRESNHTDTDFATACLQMSTLLFAILGIRLSTPEENE